MFSFSDLFQWERFVTPSIIKLFYWLARRHHILFGLSGIASALGMMVGEPRRRLPHAARQPARRRWSA